MSFVDTGNYNLANSNYKRFPLDLGTSSNQGHFMTITIFPSGKKSGNVQTVALFIPGGGQNGALQWQMAHEYDEVKLSRIGAGVASAIIGIGSDIIPGLNAAAGGLFRRQINPGVEVLYRGTELRKFDFSFIFAPQNQEDADMLYGASQGYSGDGILNRFRYYAAPETDFAGLLFKSPSEWRIFFYYKNNQKAWNVNPYLPKISKCVCTRIDVDINPDSEFSTFENGDPVSARLTMRFVEMEIIDKKLIDKGF